MTARAPRRSQPPKARGGEGGTEHEHGQGKATNGGRTAGEAAQRTKASGAMAGRSTIGRRHPEQKRRRGPPSEASRQRRGRRGGHRAEPPKGKSGKGDNCTKQLYLVAKRTIALAIAPNAVFGATVGFTPPAEPPRRTRGGAAEPLTEKTRRVGRGGVERRSAARASNAGQASNARNGATERANPAPPAGPRTTVRLQAPRCRSLYIRRRSS